MRSVFSSMSRIGKPPTQPKLSLKEAMHKLRTPSSRKEPDIKGAMSTYRSSIPLNKYLNMGKSLATKASDSDTPQKAMTHRSTIIESKKHNNSIVSFRSPFKSIDDHSYISSKNVITDEYYNCSVQNDSSHWIDFNESILISNLDSPDKIGGQ